MEIERAKQTLAECDAAMREHDFSRSTDDELTRFAAAFTQLPAESPAYQAALTMRLDTIRHLQMARLITDLNRRNDKTQFWFMVLAIGSIAVGAIGSIAQIVGVLRDFGVLDT